MQIKTSGIVIRQKASGDDRLVTLLTKDNGVLQASARGAKKPRGHLTSATELFCYSNLTLFFYKDYYTIDSIEVEQSFFELRNDLTALSLASYFAELCCELIPQEEEAGELLRLLLNCLHFLIGQKRPATLIKSIFEWRVLSLAGFMPDLTGCADCKTYEDEEMLFCIETGELMCKNCCHSERPVFALSQGVLSAMRHIVYSDFSQLFSFSLPDPAARYMAELGERYLKHHLQLPLKTLEFYHSIVLSNT